jgi:hypothetical protein
MNHQMYVSLSSTLGSQDFYGSVCRNLARTATIASIPFNHDNQIRLLQRFFRTSHGTTPRTTSRYDTIISLTHNAISAIHGIPKSKFLSLSLTLTTIFRRKIMGETGGKLNEMIKKAIRDLEVTTSEYEEIFRQANEDSQIDSQEQNLLKQLQDMIANGTIKRTPG